MVRSSWFLILGWIALHCAIPAQGSDISLDVKVNRNEIYLGESVLLEVRVKGTNKAPQPSILGIKNCKSRFLGSQNDSRQSIVFINGQLRRDVYTGRTFQYELTPTSAGTFHAGPVQLGLHDKTLTAKGQTVQVIGLEKQDKVIISVTPSRDTVLVDEPFDVNLSIAVMRLQGRYAGHDPLNPSTPPHLEVDYLNKHSPGLNGPNIGDLLRSLLIRTRNSPGFALNDYTVRNDPFDFGGMFDLDIFNQDRRALFMFKKREITRDKKAYFEYTLGLRYVPKEEGNFTFGPVTFKGKVVTDVDAGGHITGQPVFAVGPACTVRVVPPPEKGRPDSYIGAIGTGMTAQAELDAQTCNVGDPLTLTLTIAGNVNMQNISPPDLSEQKDLVRNFRIYDDTVQTITAPDKTKKYQYTMRPTRAGTLEFPPVKVSYYDSNERTYKTIETKPLPVRANESPEINIADILGPPEDRIQLGQNAIDNDRYIPAPLDVYAQGHRPSTLGLKKWQIAMSSLAPLSYFLFVAMQSVRSRSRQREQLVRRKNALGAATAMFKGAGTSPQVAANAVCAAFRKYLSDKFDQPEAGLTPIDALAILRSNNIDDQLCTRFSETMERNFNAAFTQAQDQDYNTEQESSDALRLLNEVDSAANSRPASSNGSPVTRATIILLALGLLR